MRVTPIFLFSLPRSGSTLVQRVLSPHEDVSTTSEPWLLLPLFQAFGGQQDTYTGYYHREYRKAFEDFCSVLPLKRQTFEDAIRRLVLDLYGAASPTPTRYFIDKTPRYHTIVRQIIEVFDEAKVVFLWRNPLAVAASMMETWADGHWNLYRYRVDLYAGQAALVQAAQEARGRYLSLRFEDLISNPEVHWSKLFEYLDLDYDPGLLKSLSEVQLGGRMGDHTGIRSYDGLSTEPLRKWRLSFTNPLRRRWARRYLKWLREDRLAVMGYEMETLLAELEAIPRSMRLVVSDTFRMSIGLVQPWLEPEIFRDKLRSPDRHSIVAHG